VSRHRPVTAVQWSRFYLRQMIEHGHPQVHEPACRPDPTHYVSWEYARGYVDGVIDTEERH
jgi:hypothetical protein